MTSITGEKVSVNQVIEAVAERRADDRRLEPAHFKAEADAEAQSLHFAGGVRRALPTHLSIWLSCAKWIVT